MVAVTCVFEGSADEVDFQERTLYEIAGRHEVMGMIYHEHYGISATVFTDMDSVSPTITRYCEHISSPKMFHREH